LPVRDGDIPVIDPDSVQDAVVTAVAQTLLTERIDLDPETARLAAACIVLAPVAAGAPPVPVPVHARRVAWRVLLRHGYLVRSETARLAAAAVLVPHQAVTAAAQVLERDGAAPGPAAGRLAAAAVIAADGNDPGCPAPRRGPAAALARVLQDTGHGDPGPETARLACEAVLAVTSPAPAVLRPAGTRPAGRKAGPAPEMMTATA
jgi:hypothetical protein